MELSELRKNTAPIRIEHHAPTSTARCNTISPGSNACLWSLYQTPSAFGTVIHLMLAEFYRSKMAGDRLSAQGCSRVL